MNAEHKPRRRLLLVVAVVILLVAAVGAGYLLGHHRGAPTAAAHKIVYQCPMHPFIISDKPGNCPICGMTLVPVEEGATGGTAAATGEQMKGIEGMAAIEITPEMQQSIGVKTDLVKRMPLEKTIRTVGTVKEDETRISRVNAKIGGWIERLYVDYTGKFVQKGQPLLEIYSPDLVSTQEEYLLALESRDRLKNSPFPEVAKGGESLLESTRKRLELWDIPPAEIERLEREKKTRKTLTLYSPVSGYVMEKMAFPQMMIEPGMALYSIADLSTVWVEADIYEYEIPLVKVGTPATLTLASLPGQKYSGRATFIYPYVEEMTRTVKARFEFPNPGAKLKPNMYADVEIKVSEGTKLAVPEDAVIDTGTRQVAFVVSDGTHFQPREVTLGTKGEGYVEVVKGLNEGDKVVTSAQFLIDSDSRIKAAIQAMTPGAEGAGGAMPSMPGM